MARKLRNELRQRYNEDASVGSIDTRWHEIQGCLQFHDVLHDILCFLPGGAHEGISIYYILGEGPFLNWEMTHERSKQEPVSNIVPQNVKDNVVYFILDSSIC